MIILHVVNWIQLAFIYPQERQHSIIAEEHFEDCVLKAILLECISILLQKKVLWITTTLKSVYEYLFKGLTVKNKNKKKVCNTLSICIAMCEYLQNVWKKNEIYHHFIFIASSPFRYTSSIQWSYTFIS
jgi:hypothetical protein